MELATNVRLENCRVQTEVIRSIQNQPGNRDTTPFAQHQIPGRIHAQDYDQGMNGHAYSDTAWENYNLTTSNYTAWNEGWSYRNNGVDVQTCADVLSNGYSVGWFLAPEWMRYTVTVATPGTYRIELRVAKGGGTDGKLEIQDGDGLRVLASATIPDTGGDATYQTVVCNGGFASAGTQAIRIANVAGSYNIASVNFIWENATVPPTTPAKVSVQTVTLKGSNGLYVTYSNGNKLASSTASTAGTKERFTLTDAGAGRIALRASNGNYFRLNVSDNKLYADAASIGTGERFLLKNLSGAFALQGSNDLYVSNMHTYQPIWMGIFSRGGRIDRLGHRRSYARSASGTWCGSHWCGRNAQLESGVWRLALHGETGDPIGWSLFVGRHLSHRARVHGPLRPIWAQVLLHGCCLRRQRVRARSGRSQSHYSRLAHGLGAARYWKCRHRRIF